MHGGGSVAKVQMAQMNAVRVDHDDDCDEGDLNVDNDMKQGNNGQTKSISSGTDVQVLQDKAYDINYDESDNDIGDIYINSASVKTLTQKTEVGED